MDLNKSALAVMNTADDILTLFVLEKSYIFFYNNMHTQVKDQQRQDADWSWSIVTSFDCLQAKTCAK